MIDCDRVALIVSIVHSTHPASQEHDIRKESSLTLEKM